MLLHESEAEPRMSVNNKRYISKDVIGFIAINIISSTPTSSVDVTVIVYHCSLITRVTGHALKLCLTCPIDKAHVIRALKLYGAGTM